MTIEKKLLATNPVSGEVLPEAVSFDGATDYLARTSDLTGNSDGKTFTFSAWVYAASNNSTILWTTDGSNQGIKVNINNRVIAISARSGGTTVLGTSVSTSQVVENTWYHVLWSIDLANSSNRYCYINDVAVSPSFGTYTNSNISFTKADWQVSYRTGNFTQQRLAHLFLDYTYRDLSTTSNRRLFIDADGKPSSTIPSSPILYLPMTDAATAGSNSGTGGDFTVNGVLATAERGPNQDNCSASNFDGSNDYMRRTSLTGAADGKQFTVSFNFLEPVTSGNRPIFSIGAGSNQVFFARFANAGGGKSYLTFSAYQAGAPTTVVATFAVPSAAYRQATKTQNSVQISVDVTDTSKRHVYINGVALPDSWTTYTNASMDFTGDKYSIGVTAFDNYFYNGSMGEVYFNTAYIDLATDNPFWDSDTNRPNSVRKVIADTSVTPLIALPIIGSDAGNNLGSGGDFTVNSGPYTGARGGSEFWARSANFNATTEYLTRSSALTGSSAGKTLSVIVAVNPSSVTDNHAFFSIDNGSSIAFQIGLKQTSRYLDFAGGDSNTFKISHTTAIALNEWTIIMASIDLTNTSNRKIFINGVELNPNWNDYNNTNLNLNYANIKIADRHSSNAFIGDLGFLYYTQTYIDFSQEANRNKFVDQLGYPRDLTKQIDDGDIPNPLVYMKFEAPAALGTNSGTGGNFTVNGTVTAGADVTP